MTELQEVLHKKVAIWKWKKLIKNEIPQFYKDQISILPCSANSSLGLTQDVIDQVLKVDVEVSHEAVRPLDVIDLTYVAAGD